MPRKLTTEQFIEKARVAHGDRYDYSLVEYLGNRQKVTVVCSEHGSFTQTPSNHLKGAGCPKCARRPLTTEEFKNKAIELHGDRYGYSLVEYKTSKSKVTLICPIHGQFLQEPRNHLSGKGCPDCGGKKRLNNKTFTERALSVHGDRYNYSSVQYSTSEAEVEIICSVHGAFNQAPHTHLRGSGCPKCGIAAMAKKRRLAPQEYVAKARRVHNERYDYSETNYVDGKRPVTILCREHGEFEQSPRKHLLGQGCPACGGSLRLSNDEFITRARDIHGDRYDYGEVNYVNDKTKLIIICPDHGRFLQSPSVHVHNKAGCPACAGNKRLTSDTFIDRAIAIHGERYDYSLIRYKNTKEKVTIVCSQHGEFRQTPENHLSGQGCAVCAGKNVTTEMFIAKAQEVHGNRYDYSRTNYKGSAKKVTIVCPDHGPFSQTAADHLTGYGCQSCGGNKPLTKEVFIERSKAIHGDRYDYSKVVYANTSSKVEIVCPDHGSFWPTVSNHLSEKQIGCPGCADWGFNPNEAAFLYYLAVEASGGDTLYKIGITNRTVSDRFRPPDLARIRVVEIWRFAQGRDAAERESEILRTYAGERYYGPPVLLSGNTELFVRDILLLDVEGDP